jgi:hypothetical protein
MLFDNPEIRDPFASLDKDQRKENWNENFSIRRLADSTTLNISVFNEDKAEADKIARQAALSLSEVASHFYNIQTELEFRIIEGPISSVVVRSWPKLVLVSILAGILAAYFTLLVFNLFPGKIRHRIKRNIVRRDYFSPPAGNAGLYLEKEFLLRPSAKKASAPANLPIAEEDIPNVPHQPSSEIIASIPVPDAKKEGEPTDEEYRARLNRLLRGEI